MKRLKFFWPYLSNKNPKIGNRENTPLHFVAYHGLSKVADFMIQELDSVEDFLHMNESGMTPLEMMSRGHAEIKSRGHAEIIRSVRQKLDFELIDPRMFKNILREAIDDGYADCIKALLEKQTSHFQRNAIDIIKTYQSDVFETRIRNRVPKILQYLSKELKFSDNLDMSLNLKRPLGSELNRHSFNTGLPRHFLP